MPEKSSNTLHINEYVRVLRNRLWIIFTIFVLTVVSGVYTTEAVLPKVYTTSAVMQIKPRGGLIMPGWTSSGERSFDSIEFAAEFAVLHSRDLLWPVITDLQLDKIWAKRVFKSNLDALPELEALGYMNGVLKIDYTRGTNLLVVSADSEVPKEAADIANAVCDRYKTWRDVEEDSKNSRGSDELQTQISDQEKIVADRLATVKKLGVDNPEVSMIPGTSTDRLEQELDTREHDLTTAKADADSRRVLQASVKDLPDEEYITTLEALGHVDPTITSLRSQILSMQSDMDNLKKQGFEDNHPRVQAMQADLDRHEQQLKEAVAGSRRALIVDTAMASSRVELLTTEVDALRTQVNSQESQQLMPYREAQRELEKQQAVLDAYNIKLKQIKADRHLMESPVRIISRAPIPDSPSKPNKPLWLSVSMLAGLALGVIVAFLIEYLDTSVKTMADAEQLIGLPVLTVIPNKGGPMPLTAQAARLPHAEGYRILRAKLDLKVQNGVGPSLSMLSGGPGEGKSTTIYNLAVVCAQAGQSVILVDCDLRRPTLHELLHISNDRGMANFLRGEGEAVEFIHQTAIPKLHVLTAGDLPVTEIGALVGDKIRQMLDDLKRRYDLVLIDSPPVLGISDGSIIAREVDYVILIIQHRRFPREISLRAKRAIEEVHGNCVGMVLNCVAIKSDDSYYYYSNYGNYYKKVDRKKRRPGKVKSNGNGVALVPDRQTPLESDEF